MNGMKLIREFTDFKEVNVLTESISGTDKKAYFIEGPFLQAEDVNKNGRIYPKHLVEREVLSFHEDKVLTSRAVGELDHPEEPTINLDRISHLITELTMDGKYAVGKAKIMGGQDGTPCGKIVESLLRNGVSLGVSSRGVGSLKGNTVNEDFGLVTVDIVADPSAPDAYVNGIMESKEYILNEGVYVPKLEQNYERFEKVIASDSRKIRQAVNIFLKSF